MGRFYAALFLLCCLAGSTFGQEVKINVNGFVDHNYDPLENAAITLHQNGKIKEKISSDAAGIFSFTLEPGNVYEISVAKEGFVTKKLEFNTYLPADVDGHYIIEFAVGLFKPCPGIDLSILDEPLSKVVFNPTEKEFTPDEAYDAKISSHFIALSESNKYCWMDTYNKMLEAGDEAFKNGKYEEARDIFNNTLEIFPYEKYPLKQLEKAEEKLNDLQANEKIYTDAIREADKKSLANELITALTLYKKALIFKPGDAYAEQQIKSIQENIEKQEQTQTAELLGRQEEGMQQEQRLDELINNGEAFLDEGNYSEALTSFRQALSLIPDDGYLKSRIEKAEKGLDQHREELAQKEQLMTAKQTREKELDDNFNAAMAKGGEFLNTQNYEAALLAYNEAVSLKPAAQTAHQKRSEVQEIMRKNKALEAQELKQKEAYDAFIEQADALFAQKEYINARFAYQQAAGIYAQNTYPPAQIQKIDEILADKEAAAGREKSKEEQFNRLLTQGEQNLKEQKAAEAVSNFENALAIKKNDGYTLALLSKAEKMLEEQQKLANLEKQQNAKRAEYQQALNNGDNLLALKEYNEAISYYNQALMLKPGDSYAMDQKRKAENFIKQDQKQAEYQGIITSADAMFKSKSYSTAKNLYSNALKVRTDDVYAKSKINEINTILLNQEKAAQLQQQNDKKYTELIADADAKMSAKQYNEALAIYDEALAIKPEQQYPKVQKSKIQVQLSLLAKNAAYEEKIKEANTAYKANECEKAKNLYAVALNIKPGDDFSRSKIQEINNLLARLKEEESRNKALEDEAARKQNEYNQLIAEADKKYKEAYYQDAKDLYKDALSIKENQPYPLARIKKIDETLALLGRGNQSGAKTPQSKAGEDKKSSELKDIKFASDRELKDYLEKLSLSYPAGITQEIYKDAKSTTNRFVIIRGDEVVEIREVKHSWGGIDYTRNGKPITMGYFKQQTEIREGEYFKKINK